MGEGGGGTSGNETVQNAQSNPFRIDVKTANKKFTHNYKMIDKREIYSFP